MIEQLKAAKPGDVVLAPMLTAPVRLQNFRFDPPVTVRGGGLATGAVGLEAPLLSLENCSGLIFEGQTITGSGRTGRGMQVAWSEKIKVEALKVSGCCRGIVFEATSDVEVRNSDFSELRSDGLNLGNTKRAIVERCYFHDFYPDELDHPDAIQGTLNTSDVTIRDNLIRFNLSGLCQGIYAMRGSRWTVEDNLLLETHWNAVLLDAVADAVARRNRVAYTSPNPYRPWVRAKGQNGVVEGNSAATVFGYAFRDQFSGDLPHGNKIVGPTDSTGLDRLETEWLRQYRAPSRSQAIASILADLDTLRERVAALA